ncbi:hypothetical protein Lesp02_63120 [Lentzea sp. NBRC 105346]|uniref:hypothetical protein n=1 Tax=Lentzea sp. NBRC 105346 TaxID=3032205 RepID=UPI00249FC411|nr:hypothetical protein [Lentzea sp. NBRC 105346]GLZ34125.1 hypothetical protein Lesp02_63120 [Lentzea sp. NBRC 105346]
MRLLGVLALASVLLAGCSSGGSPSGSSGVSPTSSPGTGGVGSSTVKPPAPTPPVTISDTAVVVPPGVKEVPREKVDAGSLSDTYRRDAFVFNDGRDVQVWGVAGGCKEAKAEVTGQSAEVVQVTLVTITRQPSGTVCTQELKQVPLTVHLDAPLGDRQLVLEAREESG